MNWERVWTANNLWRLAFGDWPDGALGGLAITLILGVLAIVACTVLGTLIGVMRASRNPAIRGIATLYVQTLRNIPLLILIFWAYFLPPYLDFDLSKFTSVLIALTVFTAAYIAEIVRGGIASVPAGAVLGARALGLSEVSIWRWVILPQAFFNMIPAITGRYITVIKNTSLAFLIGLTELTEVGRQINSFLMSSPIEVYFTLLMIYFVVNRGISMGMRLLESLPRFNRLFLRV